MPATLILLRRDMSGEWLREGREAFEDDEAASGENKARAQGEAWVSEGSDQPREYRILRA